MNNTARILEEVTKTSIELLLKEPFYSHLFSALNKEIVFEDSHIKTMAVGLRHKTYVLIVNAPFWDNELKDKKHRFGVVKHEVLHLVFKHLLVNEQSADKRLLNIAMDLVVNQYIERIQLPTESIFLETFPELNLEKDQTYFYYYEKLKVLQEDCKNGCGLCDSVAGKNLGSISGSSHGLERHELWKEIYDQTKIEKEVLDAQMENLIRIATNKTTSKQFGLLPAGVQQQVNDILIKEQPLVDWRRVLKLFSESSSKTKIKNTLKRPSKRYGTTPGIKIKHHQKLLIAIDTSGSISEEEYHDFFSELYHIWKRGSIVRVVECDAEIQHVYDYKGITPKVIHGGGGTDFNPPIVYANNIFNPDALIYFTDGYAAVPTVQAKVPVLWVISREGITPNDEIFENLIGRKAKLQA